MQRQTTLYNAGENLPVQPAPSKTRYIVGCGAESTGKTTLLLSLYDYYADQGYDVAYIEEYLRIPCEEQIKTTGVLKFDFRAEDFVNIIVKHICAELDHNNKQIVFCDTDPLTIQIWCKRYCGTIPDYMPQLVEDTKNKFYLVTEYDPILTPLVQDGLRDGSEEIRQRMDLEFKQLLKDGGKEYVIIGGPLGSRLDAAISEINKILTD